MPDWDGIVREHGPMAFRTAWRILGHAADTEDVVQESLLEAFEVHHAQTVSNWGGLLRRIATYRALDARYARTALCLGATPARVFWQVKLPMLVRPVLFALAVGFAVSVAQYLPTLFAGGGRFPTLATEAVGLAAGADRRIVGVYAFLQALLPLLAFAAALAAPRLLLRRQVRLRRREAAAA